MNDGGPAFPVNDHEGGLHAYPNGSTGMSLRDYFAAKAMQGLLAMHADPNISNAPEDVKVARWSYELADVMLAERAKK